MTRAERRAVNRAAHALRRELTNADYRTARAAGDAIAWRDIAAVYDAIPAADILAMRGELVTAGERTPGRPAGERTPGRPADDETPAAAPARRRAPAHIVRASEAYALALAAWQAGLDDALRGGRTLAAGGRPARGETFPDEERDYRDAHPKPAWLDFVRAESAANLHGANA